MAAHHDTRPHLLLLALADVVLIGSALLTRNRGFMLSIALVAAVVMTLTYLFIWNRIHGGQAQRSTSPAARTARN